VSASETASLLRPATCEMDGRNGSKKQHQDALSPLVGLIPLRVSCIIPYPKDRGSFSIYKQHPCYSPRPMQSDNPASALSLSQSNLTFSRRRHRYSRRLTSLITQSDRLVQSQINWLIGLHPGSIYPFRNGPFRLPAYANSHGNTLCFRLSNIIAYLPNSCLLISPNTAGAPAADCLSDVQIPEVHGLAQISLKSESQLSGNPTPFDDP